jgi:hypothetical protein
MVDGVGVGLGLRVGTERERERERDSLFLFCLVTVDCPEKKNYSTKSRYYIFILFLALT